MTTIISGTGINTPSIEGVPLDTSANLPITAAYYSPVLWNGSTDRVLGAGQITQDSFTSATSMPLNIVCGDGQVYEIDMVGSYTAAAAGTDPVLQPNNAVPTTNIFTGRGLYVTNTTVTGLNGALNVNGFDLCAGSASILVGKFTLFTSTLNKKIIVDSASNTSTDSYKTNWAIEWNDTTTPYTSIGTVIMPIAWTGQIVVKRIA